MKINTTVTLAEKRKKRLKKIRRRRRIKRLLCFTGFCCLFVFCSIHILNIIPPQNEELIKPSSIQTVNSIQESSPAPVTTSESDIILQLRSMAETEPKINEILSHLELYPENIISLLINRPEAINFVLQFPALSQIEVDASQIDMTEDIKGNAVPLFLQWDTRWGYCKYGTGIIGLDGCGPTCLSMVLVALTNDTAWNPLKVANFSENNGYFDPNNGTAWDLMTSGATALGLASRELSLDENIMSKALSNNQLIICSVRPGDFTKIGHFIVLYGYENGKFLVNDPNSTTNSQKQWDYATLQPQIKNIWAFSKN